MSILRELYERILADSEADSDASGYLSWRGEWHSAAFGLAIGLLASLSSQWIVVSLLLAWVVLGPDEDAGWINLPYPRQFVKESAYLVGHTTAGVAIGLGLRAWILPSLPTLL